LRSIDIVCYLKFKISEEISIAFANHLHTLKLNAIATFCSLGRLIVNNL